MKKSLLFLLFLAFSPGLAWATACDNSNSTFQVDNQTGETLNVTSIVGTIDIQTTTVAANAGNVKVAKIVYCGGQQVPCYVTISLKNSVCTVSNVTWSGSNGMMDCHVSYNFNWGQNSYSNSCCYSFDNESVPDGTYPTLKVYPPGSC